MKAQLSKLFSMVLALMVVVGVATAAPANGGEHKIVIQVSSGDEATQNLALNNVANLQTALGIDNVEIELVAYGPGLSILTKASAQSARVASLAQQNVVFSACANTMKGIEKKTGSKPQLTDGVQVVPGGVIRIMDLQEQGYSYLRP